MRTSHAGIGLIKVFEGCRLKAYQDSAGIWTIGYGTTTAAGFGTIGPGMTITQDQADEWLAAGLVKYEAGVMKALTRSPTQNQFDAMVSLCYNIGPGAFAKSSVARLFNGGDVHGAADAFLMWNRAGGKVLPGLSSRRRKERERFLLPVEASTAPISPAPTSPAPEPGKPATDAETGRKPPSIQTVTLGGIILAILYGILAALGWVPTL